MSSRKSPVDGLRFSIVIPVYNRRRSLGTAVRSALAAVDGRAFREVLLVDDGSTDASAGVIRSEYGSSVDSGVLRIVSHPFNRGVNAARNTGTLAARGDWIIYLDSDDELIAHVDAIEDAIRSAPGYPEIVFFPSIAAGGTPTGAAVARPEVFSVRRIVREGLPGECMAVARRELMLRYPFNESTRGFEGITWASIARDRGNVIVLPLVTRKYCDDPSGDRLSTRANRMSRACTMARGWAIWLGRFWWELGVLGVARAMARIAGYSILCITARVKRFRR